MKGKIVLCSNLIDRHSKEEFEKFLGRKTDGMKVLFIPTGGNPEPNLTWIKEDYSIIVEDLKVDIQAYDIEDMNEGQIRELVPQFDMIWMSGGVTSYLMNAVIKTGFNNIMKEVIENDIVYVGSSSGAMILNPTLDVAAWYIGEEDSESAGVKGLGYTDYYVYPHYHENLKEEIIKRKNFTAPLYLMKNEQAICIDNGEITYLGGKPEIV
ncbi:MAG TPA: Type 1 glutamine amidotransferase-like domain-containing protein [Candidatus Dojkabacteria bacterium]|nr:Type 1 glutamine amidotransferase-like domain-containing protein [Candidatus Dojkabacteria bacterium]